MPDEWVNGLIVSLVSDLALLVILVIIETYPKLYSLDLNPTHYPFLTELLKFSIW